MSDLRMPDGARDAGSMAVDWLYTNGGELVSWSEDAKTYWDANGEHWAWRDGDWFYKLGGKPIGWIREGCVYDAETDLPLLFLRPPQ